MIRFLNEAEEMEILPGQMSFDDIDVGDKIAKGEEIISKIKSKGNTLSSYFSELVPTSGHAETKGGELVRCMMRLLYRDYNDGDKYYDESGSDACGSAAAFLDENGFNEIEEFAKKQFDEELWVSDGEYTKFLKDLSNKVIKHIEDNPELVVEPVKDTMEDFESDYYTQYSEKYTYDVILPDYITDVLNDGLISLFDIIEEISSWDNCENVREEFGELIIPDLSKDAYENIMDMMPRSLDLYEQELKDRFFDDEE